MVIPLIVSHHIQQCVVPVFIEILSTIERYGKESKKSHISLLELMQIRYKVLETYESNKELFERFHRETQELKRDISFGVRNKALELKKEFNIEVDINF